jgi:hypothetical protein
LDGLLEVPRVHAERGDRLPRFPTYTSYTMTCGVNMLHTPDRDSAHLTYFKSV